MAAFHSLHAVHAVDALGYFLRSTKPKMHTQAAASAKEHAAAQELYKQKVTAHIFAGVCLTACVFIGRICYGCFSKN